jgi:plasmid stabilization system protein ParE
MLLPAAAADVEETYAWYETQTDGLGDEFLSVFQATLEGLRADPHGDPQVHGEIRRHLLKRFPHVVFYRVVGGRVVVLACLPASRRSPSGRGSLSGSRDVSSRG